MRPTIEIIIDINKEIIYILLFNEVDFASPNKYLITYLTLGMFGNLGMKKE